MKAQERKELVQTLKARFEKNLHRHSCITTARLSITRKTQPGPYFWADRPYQRIDRFSRRGYT